MNGAGTLVKTFLTSALKAAEYQMETPRIDKKKLPSRNVSVGAQRAPHRSYCYAMRLTSQQIVQPFVGVASCWNESAPCNISLMRKAQAVKKGVAGFAGTPREFCTITVTDGIAMIFSRLTSNQEGLVLE